MIETIEEAQEASPIIYQAIALVIFHPDAPSFSPSVLPREDEWPALPVCADTAHAAPALTKTDAPEPATLAAEGSGKISSNRARPTDGQTASPSTPADLDSDVTLVESIRGSDSYSDYVYSDKTSPTRPANTPDLAGHSSELEEMHEVVEGELDAIAQPTVLFSHTDELKITELANTDTNPP